MKKAIFLDKDGTLIPDIPYNVDPARVRLLPGVADTLRRLGEAGYILIVVSNQSGIARGLFTEDELQAAFDHLSALLAREDVKIEAIYWCPHHPAHGGPCDCRKPAPGLLNRAIGELQIDPAQSWIVGDTLDDVEAGARAGCRTILVGGGGEEERGAGNEREPHFTVRTFSDVYGVVTG